MKKYFWLAVSVMCVIVGLWTLGLAFTTSGTAWDHAFYAVISVVWVLNAYTSFNIFQTEKATERIRAKINDLLDEYVSDDPFWSQDADKLTN